MTDKLDCIVIGAGVVGLAIARAMVIAGRDVIVLEAEAQVGVHSSSRNSEVIHSGIYYPDNSLKARLCVRGKQLLYEYCESHHVAYQRIGKLIVATNERDLDELHRLQEQAERNGVDDLRLLNSEEVHELEADVVCVAALLSPSTGIIDSHGLMSALQADIES